MATLRIGTCSWKFPSWVTLVYSTPEGAPDGSGYLGEYARRYHTVEVDQWFWSLFGPETIGLPKPEDVTRYRAAVPDDFRFSIKAPNSITLTHFYHKDNEPLTPNPHFLSTKLFTTFLELLEPLRPVMGPLMFQFEYLNRQKMATQARFQALFGAFRRNLPDGVAYALEVRNPQYLNRAYFQFLEAFDLLPVLVQGYWMPDIREVYQEWREALWTHPTVIIRLMGPDRQAIEALAPDGWHRIVLSKDEELPGIAALIEELLEKDVDVYVNVNNHYEGSSPLTIERLGTLVHDAPSPNGPAEDPAQTG